LQEVSTLIARNGMGVSHAIGVGGRDLKEAVGGITTLMALDALERDPATRQIVLISKPPAASVAKTVLGRIARMSKRVSIGFIGAEEMPVPPNATLSSDLRGTAESALAGRRIAWPGEAPRAGELASRVDRRRRRARGLFSGGTLCAEAQVVFRRAGIVTASNVPIPGVGKLSQGDDAGNVLLDLGDDAYTVGRPHPMIDPTLRNEMLEAALRDDTIGVVLLDVVLGYGAHPDPAADLLSALPQASARKALLVTSVCGTDGDPQGYSRQADALRQAGIVVAPSNAHAAECAAEVLRALA
jgi:succinyl-CoA synthetase alpha subunit